MWWKLRSTQSPEDGTQTVLAVLWRHDFLGSKDEPPEIFNQRDNFMRLCFKKISDHLIPKSRSLVFTQGS